jgi:hypothetical protein
MVVAVVVVVKEALNTSAARQAAWQSARQAVQQAGLVQGGSERARNTP